MSGEHVKIYFLGQQEKKFLARASCSMQHSAEQWTCRPSRCPGLGEAEPQQSLLLQSHAALGTSFVPVRGARCLGCGYLTGRVCRSSQGRHQLLQTTPTQLLLWPCLGAPCLAELLVVKLLLNPSFEVLWM